MKATRRKRERAASVPGKAAAGKPALAPQRSDAATPANALAGARIVLAANCTVKNAAALKESLLAALPQDGAVTIDVRGLEGVDTAAMQLLCAFVRDRRACGRQVAWLGESRALQEAAGLLGVAHLLALASCGEDAAAAAGIGSGVGAGP